MATQSSYINGTAAAHPDHGGCGGVAYDSIDDFVYIVFCIFFKTEKVSCGAHICSPHIISEISVAPVEPICGAQWCAPQVT